jgi:hypothetical protein
MIGRYGYEVPGERGGMRRMGTFRVWVTILNPSDPALSTTLDCLVETGAAYSQAPRSLLVSLGIAPFDRRPVIFADG